MLGDLPNRGKPGLSGSGKGLYPVRLPHSLANRQISTSNTQAKSNRNITAILVSEIELWRAA